MHPSPRVLIVDDHFFLRQGVKTVLREHFPQLIAGEACDGRSALKAVWADHWDVVLLDISMPGRDGLETLKDLKKAKPEIAIIILSMHSEDLFAIRALKAGASAYIRKDHAGTELVKAVGNALRGERYITPSLAEKLASHVQQNCSPAPHDDLSDREHQVMCLLAKGKTVKEIGALLILSVKTISTYRTRILEKLHLKNNSQLMVYAIKHGLIESESAV
jgi:two-component system, NarL family, invasion response regulator UvrY